jgi:hypothetical protein
MTTPNQPAVPHHPDGKTCADCIHFKRCSWLLSYSGKETQCDWAPSRFRAKEGAALEAQQAVPPGAPVEVA